MGWLQINIHQIYLYKRVDYFASKIINFKVEKKVEPVSMYRASKKEFFNSYWFEDIFKDSEWFQFDLKWRFLINPESFRTFNTTGPSKFRSIVQKHLYFLPSNSISSFFQFH